MEAIIELAVAIVAGLVEAAVMLLQVVLEIVTGLKTVLVILTNSNSFPEQYHPHRSEKHYGRQQMAANPSHHANTHDDPARESRGSAFAFVFPLRGLNRTESMIDA